MKTIHFVVVFLTVSLLSCLPSLAMGEDSNGAGVRRFALLIGANDGGPERVQLRYATDDAAALGDVLEKIGGVDRENQVLLMDPNREELDQALLDLGDWVGAAKGQQARTEVIFYYSGHSDELGLRLGSDLYPYPDLKESIFEVDADVRLVILDSCASGAMTRVKGGSFKSPFLVNDANSVKGYAILTSSSADEAAQESDRIGASYFTHSLVSGLRGAADTTGDGQVTLNEVYNFAFNETLARTEKTQVGPQHPAYDIQLAGTGDLVLTDLRGTSATLELPREMSGRIFIRNEDGQLVVEVNKLTGKAMILALEPGIYDVTIQLDESLHGGQFSLDVGSKTGLDFDELEPLEGAAGRARGNQPAQISEEIGGGDGGPRVTIDITLTPPLSKIFQNDEYEDHEDYEDYEDFEDGHDCDDDHEGDEAHDCDDEHDCDEGHDWDEAHDHADDCGDGDCDGHGGSGRSISLGIAPHVQGLEGLQIGLLTAHVSGPAEGLQISSLVNTIGGPFEGMQISALVNRVGGPLQGIQATGLVNAVGGPVEGIQTAGLVNRAGGPLEGVQAAGLINTVGGPVEGTQAAGLINVAGGPLQGWQAAGLVNRVAGPVEGVQAAGLMNITQGSVEGLQIAGLLNVAEEVEGAQIGLINISEHIEGVPLGLINIVGDGERRFSLYETDLGLSHFAFHMGSHRFYSQLNVGWDPTTGGLQSKDRYAFGAGFGLHYGRKFWLNVDVLSHQLVEPGAPLGSLHLLNQGRALFGFQVIRRFGVFMGPTLNVLVTGSEDGTATTKVPEVLHLQLDGDPVNVFIWPGVTMGIQLL